MAQGKISVRRELREPDAFMKTVDSVLKFAARNRRLLTIAGIVLLVLLTTVIGGSWYISDRNQTAESLLNQALMAIEDKPLAEITPQTKEQLDQLSRNFEQTAAGPVASYLLANQEFRAGKLAQAASFYQQNLQQHQGPESLRQLQAFGAAVASYEQQDFAAAISKLERLQAERSFIGEDLFILLGLSYEKSAQPEKAVATYENMIQFHANSIFKLWAEERLLALKQQG